MTAGASHHGLERPARRHRGLRERFYDAFEGGVAGGRSAKVVTIALIVLVLANVAAYVIETVPSVSHTWRRSLELFNAVSISIFTLEYVVRLWVAIEDPAVRRNGPVWGRLLFALSPFMLIDLLVVLPFWLFWLFAVPGLESLAVFRLLRFLKLARFSPALATIGSVLVHERRALFGTLIVVATAVVAAATIMYQLEREAQPDKFGSIPDAMWWAIVTLATVGYGDVFPVTPMGKLVAGVTMIIGIGVVALPIGIIANGYAQEIKRRDFVVSWAMIARVPLFEDLDTAALADLIRHLRSLSIPAGHTIYYEGDPADALYFVASGEVEILVDGVPVVAEAGDFFGEVSVMESRRRSGRARSIRRTHLLILEAADFGEISRHYPEIRQRIETVSEERIRQRETQRGAPA